MIGGGRGVERVKVLLYSADRVINLDNDELLFLFFFSVWTLSLVSG